MGGVKSLTCGALVIASVICGPAAHGHSKDVPCVPSTGGTLDEVFTGLNGVIERAEKTGDYVLAKAALKAKDAIDAWRMANRKLLNKAFADLDPATRENFGRARTLVNEANEGTRNRLETAEQLTDNANRIVERLPGPGRRAYILRSTPRIVPPQNSSTLAVSMRGVNLDQAEPVLHLPDGLVEWALTEPQEAQFIIPVNAIPSDPSRLRVHTLDVTYTTPAEGFFARILGRREAVSRHLALVTLPSSVATFELSGTRTYDRRIEMQFTAEPVQFRGSRERVYKVASPPSGSQNGKVVWRWDLSKAFRLVQSRGVQGRCEGIDMNRSSENGITMFARLEREGRSRRRRNGGPGWVDCTLIGTIYRIEQATVPIDKQTVTLTWTKDESVPLPARTDAAELIATTFDGRTRRFAASATDKFFEVRREPNRFLIVPKVPEDVLAGD